MLQQNLFDNTKQHVQECRDLFNSQGMSSQTIQSFQNTIYDYYHQNKRPFSWREKITPYNIVVSEVMLQQTQTNRVEKKFDDFIEVFPSFQSLAEAPFEQVLKYWKGLGYNRRALNLQKIAQIVMNDHNGTLPNDPSILVNFPGIGTATAASITSFAFNTPTTFIETNVRTVFIYFFFSDQLDIHDKVLMPLIEKTVDHENAREWYYALMDYGVMIKKTVGNLCRLSKHYAKQSKFEGSDRQLRGKVLQYLLDHQTGTKEALRLFFKDEKNERVEKIVEQLITEGFVKIDNQTITLI